MFLRLHGMEVVYYLLRGLGSSDRPVLRRAMSSACWFGDRSDVAMIFMAISAAFVYIIANGLVSAALFPESGKCS
jgi:hypothetical protein